MCLIKAEFVGKKELWHYQDARYNDKRRVHISCNFFQNQLHPICIAALRYIYHKSDQYLYVGDTDTLSNNNTHRECVVLHQRAALLVKRTFPVF